MSRISTHVLDTSTGKPAPGVRVRLFRDSEEILSAVTDADGRCSNLLNPGVRMIPGVYRLIFDIEAYFEEGFYPEVAITFRVRDAAANYHVPLLISPYGFTTYRGS